MAASEVKNQFKVPEGRYVLHSAKTMGLVPFAMRRTTRLTIATLHGGGEEGMYMIYNVGDYLHVSPFDATEKVRQRSSAYAACWMCYCLCAVLLLQLGVPTINSMECLLHICFRHIICRMMHICTKAPPTYLFLQEPLCSLIFNPSAVRDGFPCCHAYYASRDGCDLIVGIANGEGEQQCIVPT